MTDNSKAIRDALLNARMTGTGFICVGEGGSMTSVSPTDLSDQEPAMTDRFVPDKPGYYWVDDGADGPKPFWVWKNHRGKLRASAVHADENGTVGDYRWIAPVPRPDVVDGLVAALEAVLNQDGDRYDKVSAALQRYRGG